jgi:hypothetical protein
LAALKKLTRTRKPLIGEGSGADRSSRISLQTAEGEPGGLVSEELEKGRAESFERVVGSGGEPEDDDQLVEEPREPRQRAQEEKPFFRRGLAEAVADQPEVEQPQNEGDHIIVADHVHVQEIGRAQR